MKAPPFGVQDGLSGATRTSAELEAFTIVNDRRVELPTRAARFDGMPALNSTQLPLRAARIPIKGALRSYRGKQGDERDAAL